jgi:hypothetical protein
MFNLYCRLTWGGSSLTQLNRRIYYKLIPEYMAVLCRAQTGFFDDIWIQVQFNFIIIGRNNNPYLW